MRKSLMAILCGMVLTSLLTGCGCEHEQWNDATCDSPKTCADCGLTEGESLQHKWTDATCAVPKTCALCGETDGNLAEHKWQNATCESPKTCTVCEETEGDPIGHQWESVSCKAPKTCNECGKTEGTALEHKWSEATCDTPKICTDCGTTSGSALGHKFSKGSCSVCGADDPYSPSLSEISTIDELEKYLNANYSSIETIYGTVPVKIKIVYPKTNSDYDLYGFDMYIQCNADFMIYDPLKKITEYNWVLLPWDLDYLNVSDSDRQSVCNAMKTYQKSIANDAMTCFPSSYIMGGFYDFTESGWTVSGDYVNWHDSDIDKYFTWTNFVGRSGEHSYYDSFYRDDMRISGFGWASDGDDTWFGYN